MSQTPSNNEKSDASGSTPSKATDPPAMLSASVASQSGIKLPLKRKRLLEKTTESSTQTDDPLSGMPSTSGSASVDDEDDYDEDFICLHSKKARRRFEDWRRSRNPSKASKVPDHQAIFSKSGCFLSDEEHDYDECLAKFQRKCHLPPFKKKYYKHHLRTFEEEDEAYTTCNEAFNYQQDMKMEKELAKIKDR